MFNAATAFNQDISSWCVSKITSKPSYFDSNSAFEGDDSLQPQWGTCPVVFYKQKNGIITCNDAPVNSVYTLDGIEFTKIGSKTDLKIFNGQVDATQACTSDINDMAGWFASIDNFNKNISSWDTSSVTNMDYMFYDSKAFDQNISNWCVKNIPIKPNEFDDGSAFVGKTSLQPQWGTCPTTPIEPKANMTPIYYLLLN
jgi:surface protein